MSIQVHCPHCGKSYSIKPEQVGKNAKCSCGQVFVLSPPDAENAPPAMPPAAPTPVEQFPPGPEAGPVTSGLAIASFVLGLCSICGGALTALPAIILGIVALSRIRASGGRLQGGGFAVAGIATGGALMVVGTAMLMAILMPTLSRAREQGRRAVCLSNLKQLQLAWIMYVQDNDWQIVNGVAGVDRSVDGSAEKAWVAKDWADGYQYGQRLSQDEQKNAIRDGSLWPYIKAVELFHCPSGHQGHVRTYSIVDSMNGIAREQTEYVPGTFIKTLNMLRSPGRRMVFVDVGFTQPETYAVHYAKPAWFDPPPARHGHGTNLSFADGHSEYWRWSSSETIRRAKDAAKSPGSEAHLNWSPTSGDALADLQKVQKACWGQLGY